MIEILTLGNITNDFNRLGIEVRQTYKMKNNQEYGVCEVTEKEFNILIKDAKDETDEDSWNECGWRWTEGSNQGSPNATVKVKGKDLLAWSRYDDLDEEDYEQEYEDILDYLCNGVGASQSRNVCALLIDLANFNYKKLSELLHEYLGEE